MLALVLVGLTNGALIAQTSPASIPDHPRRTQVNNRLNNQNQNIDKKVEEGKMSKAEGAKLHQNDKKIRTEEKSMAKQNGGHISKPEQKTLNQQESKNSKAITNH